MSRARINRLDSLVKDDIVEVEGFNGDSGTYIVTFRGRDSRHLQKLHSPETDDFKVTFSSTFILVDNDSFRAVEIYGARDNRYKGWKYCYQSPNGPHKLIVKTI